MGDSAREPSDRLELLRVQQLLPQLAIVGDVAIVDDDDPLAVLATAVPDRLDRAPGAVAVAQPELHRFHLFTGDDGGEGLLDVVDVLLVQQRETRQADELLRLAAEHALHRRALEETRAVHGENRDHLRGVLDQRPKQQLAAAQEGVGPVPLGHVLTDRDDPGDDTRLVVLEGAAPADVAALAGAGPDRAVEVRPDLSCFETLEVVGANVGIVVEPIEPVAADDLLAGPAGQLEESLVRERGLPLRVDGGCDQGQALERFAVALVRLEQRSLRGQLLGDVPEGPDAADDLAVEPLRHRVTLDRPAVGELEEVLGGDRPVLAGDRCLAAAELVRVGQATGDVVEDSVVVARSRSRTEGSARAPTRHGCWR